MFNLLCLLLAILLHGLIHRRGVEKREAGFTDANGNPFQEESDKHVRGDSSGCCQELALLHEDVQSALALAPPSPVHLDVYSTQKNG